MLKAFHLKYRVLFAFLLVSSFTLIVGSVGYFYLQKVVKKYDHVININMANLDKMGKMKDNVRIMRGRMNFLIGFSNPRTAEAKKTIREIENAVLDYEKEEKEYKKIPFVSGEEVIYNRVIKDWNILKGINDKLLTAYLKEGLSKHVINIFLNEYVKYSDNFFVTIDALKAFQDQQSKKWIKESAEAAALSTKISLGIIIFGLIVSAILGSFVSKLYQNLQDSIKTRDTFLSIASHELKTPLTSLILQSQMRERLLQKGKNTVFSLDKLKKMFEADTKQLRRLNRLIDDMLDISRMRMGKISLKKERVDLTALAREVVERFRPQLEEISEFFTFESSGEIWIEADPYRMEQVIDNLLTNAMKYGNRKPLEIKVLKQEKLKKAYFCISDKGIGISAEDQKRIFTRFERAVSPNDVSGLGLGLSIAKDIVEAHGGTILLSSELGVGSTFSVELPLG